MSNCTDPAEVRESEVFDTYYINLVLKQERPKGSRRSARQRQPTSLCSNLFSATRPPNPANTLSLTILSTLSSLCLLPLKASALALTLGPLLSSPPKTIVSRRNFSLAVILLQMTQHTRSLCCCFDCHRRSSSSKRCWRIYRPGWRQRGL